MAELNPTMFREYDLRGRINENELNEISIPIIAKAYGTMLRKRNIDKTVLGHDYRKESEWISEAFIEGLKSTGIEIFNLGMIITPMMYSAQYHYETPGGVSFEYS